MMDWRPKIVELIATKQAIAEVDTDKIWPWHLPAVNASEDQISRAEEHLGYALADSYRCFLLYANGWRGFMQYTDLFGTDELVGGGRMARAKELLAYLQADGVVEAESLDASALIPIAVNAIDTDLFVVDARRRASRPIYWFAAGALIEQFGSFDEFFDEMLEYNRRLYQRERESTRST